MKKTFILIFISAITLGFSGGCGSSSDVSGDGSLSNPYVLPPLGQFYFLSDSSRNRDYHKVTLVTLANLSIDLTPDTADMDIEIYSDNLYTTLMVSSAAAGAGGMETVSTGDGTTPGDYYPIVWTAASGDGYTINLW